MAIISNNEEEEEEEEDKIVLIIEAGDGIGIIMAMMTSMKKNNDSKYNKNSF